MMISVEPPLVRWLKEKGVTEQTVNAELTGAVDQFMFKNYSYENVEVDGLFNKRLFTGELIAHDDNIDLNFNGTINFNTPYRSLIWQQRLTFWICKP